MSYDLKELQRATDEAIRELEASKDQHAVNWADLRCVAAYRKVDQDGEEEYEAIIEEASPDAWEFRQAVYAILKAKGFGGCNVVTAW